MRMEHALDTLEYASDLRKGGMPAEMAEAAARALAKQVDKSIATKGDLERLRLELKADIERARNVTIGAVVAIVLGGNSLLFAALRLVS